jgi:PKD repeat protein
MLRLTNLIYLFLLLPLFASAQTPVANFSYQADQIDPNSGIIHFSNLSTGAYDHASWDYGDGATDLTNNTTPTITHVYASFGAYTVTLSIWSDTSANYSTFTETVNVISSDVCAGFDCVWPGDANMDGVANFQDALYIGLGYGTSGPARVNPSMDWNGQPADDWGLSSANGVDYKHLDANGDGMINEFDFEPCFELNYTPLIGELITFEENQPVIELQFVEDSIIMESGQLYTVEAEVLIGTSNVPASSLYGTAFSIEIPADLAQFVSAVDFNYDGASFLGPELAVISSAKLDINQADVAITRINGLNANGFGVVGTLRFIIIGDIIDGRVDGTLTFPVTFKTIDAMDANGQPKEITTILESSGVVFKSLTSAQNDIALFDFTVAPNPAQNQVAIKLPNNALESVRILDISGKVVQTIANIQSPDYQLNTSNLSNGMYLLEMITTDGLRATNRLQILR